MAKAAQLQGASWRTYVLTGDGELQEGSNWEAAMAAAHFELGNLTLVIDRNRLQQGARTADTNDLEPLADKWRAFGWHVEEVDGHDFGSLLAGFAEVKGRDHQAYVSDRSHQQGSRHFVCPRSSSVAPQGT